MKKQAWIGWSVLLIMGCQTPKDQHFLTETLGQAEGLEGKTEYLNSPYVTAGDRLYMVGHQSGAFPDLGWHVPGEMGGIWAHPIKLMDGFAALVEVGKEVFMLDSATQFVNYPFANAHYFEWKEKGLKIKRQQFVPDQEEALFFTFELTNDNEAPLKLNFSLEAWVDLRPVWLGERTAMNDNKDSVAFHAELQGIVGKDLSNEWHVVIASQDAPKAHQLNSSLTDRKLLGKGAKAALNYKVSLDANSTKSLSFIVAGSSVSQLEALNTWQRVNEQAEDLLADKVLRYEGIANQTKLTVSDKELTTAFRWTKYNTDWLVRDVKSLGRGLSAGIPDYPWFFGADNAYALKGAIAVGLKDLTFRTIQLLDSVSNVVNGGNGRMIHEMSTNGAVFNLGNLNETPQYATLLWEAFKWTGDTLFLQTYYPTAAAGMEWLLKEHDADANLIADGYGMMEIHGLASEMIDVAAYTHAAFKDLAQMAEVLGLPADAKGYEMKATELAQVINTDFWSEEFGSYADFIGTTTEALELIDGALIRADTLDKPWAVEELQATRQRIAQYPLHEKRPFVLYHNWVVNTPMEMGIAPQDKAIIALNTGNKYVNPFGVFVTGIDRDEASETDDGGFAQKMKVFSYTGAVMTLPTGVQAIAENNYGRPDKALDYLKRMTRSFGFALPGSMYEVSPDFGMMSQAWNIYAFAVPVVTQFFGLEPMAHLGQIEINPLMPSDWDEAQLENVTVGNGQLSLFFHRKEDFEHMRISQNGKQSQIIFRQSGVEVLQGKIIEQSPGNLVLTGASINVKWPKGG